MVARMRHKPASVTVTALEFALFEPVYLRFNPIHSFNAHKKEPEHGGGSAVVLIYDYFNTIFNLCTIPLLFETKEQRIFADE